MKIKIENLGALNESEIDIKPLTVFVGRNNAGKTWAAYAISSIIGYFGWKKYTDAFLNKELSDEYSRIDEVCNEIIVTGKSEIDVLKFFDEYFTMYIAGVSSLSGHWMNNFLGTKNVNFDNLKILFDFEDSKTSLRNNLLDEDIDSTKTRRQVICKKESGSNIIYYSKNVHKKGKLNYESVKRTVALSIFALLHNSIYRDVQYFPAERTGIMTVFSTLTPERIKKSKDDIEREKPKKARGSEQNFLISYPLAVMLGNISEVKKKSNIEDRMKKANNDDDINKYLQLADILQTEILGGELKFSNLDGKTIYINYNFKGKNDVILDMPITSSVVKDLTQLVLYLQHNVEPYELLVIDEPEMNLHPEAQAKLIEFLCMLVNAKLNILITTHSPYIVDHLVNLMKADTCKNKDEIKDKFYLGRIESFISRENVSVYMFSQNTSTSILDNEGFIDWKTFSNVSENISNLYFEL